jgi:sterol desaturase/sphingolipid hydroxylase (fatty acid hydroxylase superfamily)
MLDIFFIVIDDLMSQFGDPKKRLFLGYLFLTLVISVVWVHIKTRQSLLSSLSRVFAKNVWLSRSSLFDLICFGLNRVIFLLLQPVLITHLLVATVVFQLLHKQVLLPMGALEYAPYWLAASTFSIFYFLLDDLSRFILHFLLHRIPILWEFHKTHHSATTLTPLTVTRTHPIEGLLFVIRTTVTQGVAIAVFVALFGSKVDLITIFGVNIFVLAFHSLGSNLRHSHIPIRYPRSIEFFLISPAQHQLHHSKKKAHFDKNFGVVLSVWDRILGTFHHSVEEEIQFGLNKSDAKYTASIWSLYLQPFVGAWSCIKNMRGRAAPRIRQG